MGGETRYKGNSNPVGPSILLALSKELLSYMMQKCRALT